MGEGDSIQLCEVHRQLMEELKMGMGRKDVRFQEEGREGRLPGILYPDDLVLCGESEENLRQ